MIQLSIHSQGKYQLNAVVLILFGRPCQSTYHPFPPRVSGRWQIHMGNRGGSRSRYHPSLGRVRNADGPFPMLEGVTLVIVVEGKHCGVLRNGVSKLVGIEVCIRQARSKEKSSSRYEAASRTFKAI